MYQSVTFYPPSLEIRYHASSIGDPSTSVSLGVRSIEEHETPGRFIITRHDGREIVIQGCPFMAIRK